MKELEKTYNPKEIEDRIYSNWLEKKYFAGKIDKNKKPYSIVIPPPNITGQLHLGHALNCTMQDILIRSKRMQGYSVLWLPGTDHASISTEVKIVEKMAKEGVTKADIGREGFLERAWEWRNEFGGRIVSQLKKLGGSCDWDRERFTLDEGLNNAVNEVFLKLYKKGWIYKGEKLINWCPKCKTTISDAEVDHEEKIGGFWHFKYPIEGTEEYLEFATTRPETMLGDTAIAVNPEDERYTHLVGKFVTVPIVNRRIPIIADFYVEKDFGTGVVKITPAHDPNDYEVGLRNQLETINIMNDDGTLNKNAGPYEGLDRYDARKKIIEEFKDMGLFVKMEEIKHSVGVHERCHEVIEPLIKLQWFVKMEEMAKPAIEAVKDKSLNFVPERYEKTYLNWLENIRDWCISRQLWWGHRIPAYYCQECGHINVSVHEPEKCEKCGSTNLKQDEDSLDTWFSSALWPFSTLGWPEKTPELEYFYPTNVLVTAYDIIFFWVVRMVFSAIEQTGELPFKDVLIHGLIRDAQGRKMSKSLNNGVDPLEVIDKYGADALRFSLMMGNSAGNDLRFSEEKVESARNFINKIWNAARFIMMNFDEEIKEPESLDHTDKWILSKCNTLIKEVTYNLENYDLGVSLQKIYDFAWDEYCDWYIEMVKPRLYNKEDPTRGAALYTLHKVLIQILKLLHPYTPFVTEEIFMTLQSEEETIMLSKWPEYDEAMCFSEDEEAIELIKTAVKGIRNIRAEMNVAPSKKAKMIIVTKDQTIGSLFETQSSYIKNLASASEIVIQEEKAGISDDAVSVIIPNANIYLPFEELVDISKEIKRLEAELDKIEKEIKRAEGKLSNEGFTSKAPQSLIDAENEKKEKYIGLYDQVKRQLDNIKEKM